jgi:hypothetical protein
MIKIRANISCNEIIFAIIRPLWRYYNWLVTYLRCNDKAYKGVIQQIN